MGSAEIRKRFLEFFKVRGHAIIPSSSLAPENDSTTLFTGSGMQPLLPYLLGQKHPMGNRLVNSQKSLRAGDIEEVGDNRHTTFFEMLGNWSLGDYFKQEQLPWFFEFLTDSKAGLGLDPQKLYVTVFSGDPETGIEKDEESIAIWKSLFAKRGIDAEAIDFGTMERASEIGMSPFGRSGEARQGGRIFSYGVSKNWWSRAGVPSNMPEGEPGGPDSEVFFDFGAPHDQRFGKECHPNCDCGRFMEIGNSVFMEYKKNADGTFEKLVQRNVDFGGGLERLSAATRNDPDIFDIDLFAPLLEELGKRFSFAYETASQEQKRAMRIIADHMRAAVMIIADGVRPSNKERGYILRRLMRRAILQAYQIAPEFSSLHSVCPIIVRAYAGAFDLQATAIESVFKEEEQNFMRTLKNGLKIYRQLGPSISGKDAFVLCTTHGFPIELTLELAKKDGKDVDVEGFRQMMKEHQELSRTSIAGKFKGGLADASQETTRLHTAHHLLLASLRAVLGQHVHQKGSNITAERLRIDFSHPQKVTQEELQEVEQLVNQKIQEDLSMMRKEMKLQEAVDMGAEMEFGVKYGEMVSVYIAQDKEGNAFSKEFCGGPHVEHTGELGTFRILKEEAVSSGVRRIRAILQ